MPQTTQHRDYPTGEGSGALFSPWTVHSSYTGILFTPFTTSLNNTSCLWPLLWLFVVTDPSSPVLPRVGSCSCLMSQSAVFPQPGLRQGLSVCAHSPPRLPNLTLSTYPIPVSCLPPHCSHGLWTHCVAGTHSALRMDRWVSERMGESRFHCTLAGRPQASNLTLCATGPCLKWGSSMSSSVECYKIKRDTGNAWHTVGAQPVLLECAEQLAPLTWR